MLNFDGFFASAEISGWRTHFEEALARRTDPARHGDLGDWLTTLGKLPLAAPSVVQLDSDTLVFGKAADLQPEQQSILELALKALSPWRKGPYQIFDTFIDTEWRSDWKWHRLAPHISRLDGRRVLDVGCGNGYHCWRMLGAGADQVVGIDPSMRFLIQYLAVQHYARDARFDFLPLAVEDMPENLPIFDSVFSMGVLYHRRNPLNHLHELKNLLTGKGELILETLIVDHAEQGILRPSNRYAKMRNVWCIMTTDKIEQLLAEAGFINIRCVDRNITQLSEQRSTDWMQFHSLQQFLDADDFSKTVEGYPAPQRGIFIAEKPAP